MLEATRDAYGKALVELGKDNADIVVLDADLSKSTKTISFAKEYPDRFFDCGIAEQNMMSIAAGLAASGKVPFASTFAVFATGRCFDQLRVSVAQPGLNVKVVATHGGITVGEDGASHQGIEDIAIMSPLPNFTVIVPADSVEAAQAVSTAAKTSGPFYIRMSRSKTPVVFGDDYKFTIGKAATVRDGNDVSIISVGIMLSPALEAAENLAADGINCRVINMATVKPLDEDAILKAASETGCIVVAEEHLARGGVGSAVAQVIARNNPVPMEFVAIERNNAKSGKPEELLERCGLTSSDIEQAVRTCINRKG
ncbi:MAG: transketolase family protein [Chloroflexi bacterium]|jgi:transketolase|nr:transketolase family protein [Chloroflexota bacterium]MBT7082377.1 transketolase family protein [Chloroflexota bacterium]MBT7290617.1 transketolase family protein [Chloroflexota bacterium]